MYQPEPQSVAYHAMISDIEKGSIKIPQFQREFVWSKQKSAKLLDSIVKGYPIGTFILWRTKEQLRSIRNLGDAELPGTPAGDFIQYVLDGQQRMTSIFASLKGLKIDRGGSSDNFKEIFVDLRASDDEEIIITDVAGRDPMTVIKVVDLINANLAYLVKYPPEFLGRLDELRTRIKNYAFSTVLLREAPIDVATEVFTRINTGGSPLSVFAVMVAKTFDSAKNFDLSEKYDQLIERLKDVDYDTIPDSVVLQTLSAILVRDCDKKAILGLEKQKVIEAWPATVDAIERAVDFFRNAYRIPVSALLPYSALIIPFAYFFYRHRDKPTGKKQQYLQDFFWRTSLGGRYSTSLESRVGQDLKRIDQIIEGNLPSYDYPIDLTPQFIRENGQFSAGRSYVKAILCLLAYQEPKSFVDDSIVRISNDWLKQANSKNYHHFFPRAYLLKRIHGDPRINHVANITIVDDHLNKRTIRDRAPSAYMKDFKASNPKLEQTMLTHLIELNTFGIGTDDFDLFFEKRCEKIGQELATRVIRHPVDNRQQPIELNDTKKSRSNCHTSRRRLRGLIMGSMNRSRLPVHIIH
jgi:hypothetical protein